MKKLLVLSILLVTSISLFAQAKKPSIMVVPSDNWCIEQGYFTEYDIQGTVKKYPDYSKALQENSDLGLVISKIGEMMTERGFPLKDLQQTLKSLESQSAEDAMLTGKDGGSVQESPIDKLKKTAKSDIIMQLTWKVNQVGPKKSITFNLQGLDAYTNKQVAAASGTGDPSFTAETAVLLEEAVLAHIDQFNSQLQMHFDDMFEHGREVALRIKVFDSWGEDLESEFNDTELSEIIETWVNQNTVEHRFNLSDATENMMVFEQVRIPLFDENENPIDTRKWVRGLRKYLKSTYEIESKLMMQGLGQAQLVFGSK